MQRSKEAGSSSLAKEIGKARTQQNAYYITLQEMLQCTAGRKMGCALPSLYPMEIAIIGFCEPSVVWEQLKAQRYFGYKEARIPQDWLTIPKAAM